MAPTQRGRLCAACSKEILDLRGLSALEIGRAHAEARSAVCGVYSGAQLGSAKAGLIGAAASIALGIAMTPGGAQAQLPSPHSLSSAGSGIDDAVAVDTLRLRGILVDSATQAPLHGAVVIIRGTELGAVTDSAGRFQLNAPLSVVEPLWLTAMVIGYAAKDVEVRLSDPQSELVIELAQSNVEFTSFYVTAGPEPRPSTWRRVWRFLSGS